MELFLYAKRNGLNITVYMYKNGFGRRQEIIVLEPKLSRWRKWNMNVYAYACNKAVTTYKDRSKSSKLCPERRALLNIFIVATHYHFL